MRTPRRNQLVALLTSERRNGDPMRIPIEIGQVRLDLLTRSLELEQELRRYFSGFLGEGMAEAELDIECGAPGKIWEDADPGFESENDWVTQRDFVARKSVQGSLHRATAILAPSLDDGIHNLLRWFLAPLLLRKGVFLLHAAGVAKSSWGYVFFGQSEAGKSTCAALIHGADPDALVLGDDGVLIQANADGTAWLRSAPLGCGYSKDAPPRACVPLRGLFSLRQSPFDAIEAIPASEGIASLLASAMSVRFEEDISEKLALATRFARSGTGIRRLHFRKDAAFWDLVSRGDSRTTMKLEATHV